MPTSLIVYVLVVLACDMALIGWELAATPPRPGDLLLFCALLAAAVICIEAMRRLGQPSGVSRDLLSAWWLPIALLLPPLYALLARAQRTGSPLALLLVDVDHFKRVNDSHGHLIGDEVLRALATELRQQVRESDVVGRFGGEEFTVLLPRTDGAGAYGIAERLRANAASLSVAAADARINVTVSIGVAVLGQHGNDLFELLAAADVALYRAKDAGRDQVRIYAHATGNAAEN